MTTVEPKRKLKTWVSVLLVVAIGVVSLFLFNLLRSTSDANDGTSAFTKKISKDVMTYASDYYSSYMFEVHSNGKTEEEMNEYFSNLEEEGFAASLEAVITYNVTNLDKDTLTIDSVKDSCNLDLSRIVFRPIAPYQDKKANVELELKCED